MATSALTTPAAKSRRLVRVSAACDLCKARKVKCDGNLPCVDCKRRNRAPECTFSTPRTRGTLAIASRSSSSGSKTPLNRHERLTNSTNPSQPAPSPDSPSSAPSQTNCRPRDARSHGEDTRDTAVPLEARLLRDAEGKSIFIGDCAPMSFLQTVRYLVAAFVDSSDLPASRDSIIEWSGPQQQQQPFGEINSGSLEYPTVEAANVDVFVGEYFVATYGLIDLFGSERDLVESIKHWARLPAEEVSDTPSSWTQMLVLAIGAQELDSGKAAAWFAFSQQRLLLNMCGNMNVATVQGFTLVAMYLLRASQPNGAYLYLSLAARTAYAIGIHRTEANASFGTSTHVLRDRIWQSLRVVDILISCLLGRPPSTSDVDCTVKYSSAEARKYRGPDNLIANVQIFMIIERIVVEVYSRKRISLRIADFVSHQLKSWATENLRLLMNTATSTSSSTPEAVGATQTLCSYFYGIMLLTRPFLIYDLYEHLGTLSKPSGNVVENKKKKKFADATIDAAIEFVDHLQLLQKNGRMRHKMPLIVSWLFTTALVLTIGMLGNNGITLKQPCEKAIACLEFFESSDRAAHQYRIIVQALQKSIFNFIEKQQDRLRDRRRIASSELFGLFSGHVDELERAMSMPAAAQTHTIANTHNQHSDSIAAGQLDNNNGSLDWNIYDSDFFALPWPNENDAGLQDFLQPGRFALDGSSMDVPLFPVHDQDATPQELLFMQE